ncbi:MAG: amidohydrolase [Bacteroidetes bacterium]|nr:amidohydrolase [Bacteroidota bacterium]MDA1268535.1 amidohydrolase [Bacteroidota bacterium]
MEKSLDLRVALVQTDLHWQDKTANLAILEEKIWSLKNVCDLIFLPEMFATGFSMESALLAEPMNLQVHKWMKQLAAQTGAVITGTVIISEGGNYYNRLLWVLPDGSTQHYDKRHLFRMANEDASYAPGTQLPIFSLKGWKICPQICYDLRFPVWTRNRWNEGNAAYDLLFYVASWPAARISAWDTLLPARAIENLSYCLGVNRVGVDGNQVAYNGHSAVYDFKGEKLAGLGEKEQIQVIPLDRRVLEEYRSKFPAWKDVDNFKLLE